MKKLILSNFYKCCQSLIAVNDNDTYANVKTLNGQVKTALASYLLKSSYWYKGETLFESTKRSGLSSMYNQYGFLLGSNDTPVTLEDYQIAPLNAQLTVSYLTDKTIIDKDIEHHKITVTRAWSLTNTSTSLSVEVKEIGYAPHADESG